MDGFRNSSETRPASQKTRLEDVPVLWDGCCSLSLAVFGVFLWFEMADMAVL